MRPRFLLLAALGLALGACATLDESECRGGDWYRIGVRDGAAGYAASRLEDHRRACTEYGLGADDPAWQRGYADGLRDYCTPESGYRTGRRGGVYQHVCPVQDERVFLSAYELGRETYEVEREIEELDGRVRALQERLGDERLHADLRRDLRRQVADLYDRGAWLRRSLDRLEREWLRGY